MIRMARISAEEAEYMELAGARKDGDCSKVNVPRGVSRSFGCCDKFQPMFKGTKKFSCGTCEYVIERGARQF
jgi:hypothetical protein